MTTVQLIEDQQLLARCVFKDRDKAQNFVDGLLRRSTVLWDYDPINDRWTHAKRTIQLGNVADTAEEKLAHLNAKLARVKALQAQASMELAALQAKRNQLIAYRTALLDERATLGG